MPTARIGKLDTDRIARIMSVALCEFAAYSYESASYNRIIRESVMSKGTMYYYFQSKEDVFVTLLNAVKKEFQNLGFDTLLKATENDSYWQQTKVFITKFCQLYQDKPSIGRFLKSLLTKESRSKPNPSQETVQLIEDSLVDYFMTGQLIGAIRRDLAIELIVSLAWALIEMYLEWIDNAGEDYTTDKLIEQALDLIQRSLTNSYKAPSETSILDQNDYEFESQPTLTS